MPRESCCLQLTRFLFIYALAPFSTLLIALIAPFYRLHDKFQLDWLQDRRISNREQHERRVAEVQAQVEKWASTSAPIASTAPTNNGRNEPPSLRPRMCTAKPAWNTYFIQGLDKNQLGLAQINVDALTHVVDIDETNRVVTVEPGLMMGQLSAILLPRGWTIPVIPEFQNLTVGGTICGTGIESTSGKYGLMADTSLEYEVVLSNGAVVTCSATERPDLFHSIAWSHGTLGFLTAVKLPLLPAKKYVQLKYHTAESLEEAEELLSGPQAQSHEFVEGIAFGPNKFVVMHGAMSDGPNPGGPGRVNHINRWYKQFFYKRAEFFLRRAEESGGSGESRGSGEEAVDFIPLRDYYHRHTRGYFWSMAAAWPYTNSRLFLFFFGWLYPGNSKLGRRVLSALVGERVIRWTLTKLTVNLVVQDFILPMTKLKEALELSEQLVAVYPLWLCPCKFFNKPGLAHASMASMASLASNSNDTTTTTTTETELYVDVGIYGESQKKAEFRAERTIGQFESFCIENGGVQFLYADSYLSREDFCRMFDLSLYEHVRVEYGAQDAFPHVYDKVNKVARQIQV